MSDKYTIEVNNKLLLDLFGNVLEFDSYDEADDYIEEHEIKNAEIVRQR